MTSMHSVPVHPETIKRLEAYKRADLLNQMTYDQAVNALLDEFGFPTHAELDDFYRRLLGDSDDENLDDENPDDENPD